MKGESPYGDVWKRAFLPARPDNKEGTTITKW